MTATQIIIINGKHPLEKTGGYQTYTYNLGKLLTELKFAVKTYCFGTKTSTITTSAGEILSNHSSLYSLSIFQSNELAGLAILAPQLAWLIKKNNNKLNQSIIWGIGPWALTGALLKLFSPKKNKPYLITYYPTTFRHEFSRATKAITLQDYGIGSKLKATILLHTLIPLYSLLEKFLLVQSDFIVNHYISATKILTEQFNLPDNKQIILPYHQVISKKRFQQIKKIPKLTHPLLLLVCRQDPRKGINYFLHACNLLNQKKIVFSAIVIGEGTFYAVNKKLAQKLQLKNVHLIGRVSDPKEFLKQTDVYVFPSVEEGSSAISLLEAMKYGLPIVSTNVDGITEDLQDGKTALLVNPYNAPALADAIETLLGNSRLAKRLGQNAKRAFEVKHDVTLVKKKTKSFLYRVLREARRSS